MNELVKVGEYQIGTQKTHGVDARELWLFLEVKTKFATWIERRIKEGGFLENQDFIVIPTFGKNSGGRPIKEYVLALDASKHVGLMEKTDKGREVRQYFIECEKKFREPITTKQVVTEMYPPFAPVTQGNDPLLQQAEMFVAMLRRQSNIEAQVIETKAIAQTAVEIAQGETGFCSILGYARRLGTMIPTGKAPKIGKILSKYCRENKLPMGQAPDARHGYVNTYPIKVLEVHEYLFFPVHQ